MFFMLKLIWERLTRLVLTAFRLHSSIVMFILLYIEVIVVASILLLLIVDSDSSLEGPFFD